MCTGEGMSDHQLRAEMMTFFLGPRQCIGNEFALMEAQLAVAMTV